MGVVHRARDTALDRTVALKRMAHQLRTPADRKRFELETRALARLRHPRIVRLLDASLEGEVPYLAMEVLTGQPLDSLLVQRSMDAHATCDLLVEVLDGLAFLHENGLRHGDIKPSNLLMTASGPVLIDFGLSADLAATLGSHRTQTVAGTPCYMAPELMTDPAPTVGADLFALALVGHECLIGHNVHWLDRQRWPPVGVVVSSLMTGTYLKSAERQLSPFGPLGDVLVRALDRDPMRRYHTASIFSAAVQEARERLNGVEPATNVTQPLHANSRLRKEPPPSDAVTASLPAPTPRTTRAERARARGRRRLRLAGALAGLGLVITAIALLVPRPAPTRPPAPSAPSASVADPQLTSDTDALSGRIEDIVNGRDEALFKRVAESGQAPDPPEVKAAVQALLEEARLRLTQAEALQSRLDASTAADPAEQVSRARFALDRLRCWLAQKHTEHLDVFRFAGGPGADRLTNFVNETEGIYTADGVSLEDRALSATGDALDALSRTPRSSGPHVGELLWALADLSQASSFVDWPPSERRRNALSRASFRRRLLPDVFAPLPHFRSVALRLWDAWQADGSVRATGAVLDQLLRDIAELGTVFPASAASLDECVARVHRLHPKAR